MGHKILLADDSITIQKVIELTFSDEDFELHTVGNGQKAIDEIRSIMPHIVLCDIIMPEKNGYEVCEFIKSSPDLKHIPVLLLTGAFEPFDQERARSAGCDGFLAKPFEPQTLISKVKELLTRAPAASAAAPRPVTAPPAPPAAPVEERTVILPPGSAPPMPPPPAAPRGPQVRASSPPPPPQQPEVEYGGGLDDAFAIEAGERELTMEPGDHTVLLGRETRASGDDIWGHVSPPAPSEEEDSSTVFMAPPPAAPSPMEGYEVQYDAEDLDSTWRMPNSEPAPPQPSYSGFEDFSAPPPTPGAPPQPSRPPVPPAQPQTLPMAPPPLEAADPEPIAAPFEPYDPFVASATSGPGFEPVPSFDAGATLDPTRREEPNYDRIPNSGFQAYGEPEILPENELESMVEAPAVFEPRTAAPSVDRFDEIDASTDLDESPAQEPPSPVASASSATGAASFDDALIDRVAQRVVDKLSAKVIQEIAWEVVPDLAEGLIQKEIEALKAKLAKVPK